MSVPQSSQAEERPEGERGILFGLDWFAFTVKNSTRAFAVEILSDVLGDEWREWEVIARGGRRERTRGPHGSLAEVDFKERWVHVQIKGKGCRAVGVEAIVRLHDVLQTKLGDAYAPKRVDAAWDDFERRLTPTEFRDRFWNPVTKAKRPEVLCKARGGVARIDDAPLGGGSYTVGRRVSKRMLRVYDKAAESGGKVNAIRFELECKESVAADLMHAVAGAMGNRSAVALRFLVGFIDFREVEGGKPAWKRRRCAWWASIVADAKKARLTPEERLSLEEWRGNFTHEQSSAFRVLVDLNHGDLQAAAIELLEGNRRDNPRHRAWHRQLTAKRDGEKGRDTAGAPA
jgi:hypothetical protein